LKKIFVGNLDFGATEDSIRGLFEPHGSVERVSLMTDRDTGRSRGFAFVEMTDAEEADRAITALNGTVLNGRALNVNEIIKELSDYDREELEKEVLQQFPEIEIENG
jgi:RNA recognition motif-containing protein